MYKLANNLSCKTAGCWAWWMKLIWLSLYCLGLDLNCLSWQASSELHTLTQLKRSTNENNIIKTVVVFWRIN